jgi:hypothetical protein
VATRKPSESDLNADVAVLVRKVTGTKKAEAKICSPINDPPPENSPSVKSFRLSLKFSPPTALPSSMAQLFSISSSDYCSAEFGA